MNIFATLINNDIAAFSYFVGIIGITGLVFGFIRYKNYTTTVELQNDNIKALEDQAKIHESTVEANKIHIKALEARIAVIETLPLQSILEELKHIQTTQNRILEHLVARDK